MFAVLPSGLGPLYASVTKWWSGDECRCELNVPSRPVLAYCFSHIFDETDLREAIWRIAVSKFSVLVLTSFLACAPDGSGSSWCIDARIRSRGARGILLSFPSRIIDFVENEAFMRLFEISSFDFTRAFFAFGRTQEVVWSESSRVEWFPYSFAEGAVDRVEAFTVLGGKRGIEGELLP